MNAKIGAALKTKFISSLLQSAVFLWICIFFNHSKNLNLYNISQKIFAFDIFDLKCSLHPYVNAIQYDISVKTFPIGLHTLQILFEMNAEPEDACWLGRSASSQLLPIYSRTALNNDYNRETVKHVRGNRLFFTTYCYFTGKLREIYFTEGTRDHFA